MYDIVITNGTIIDPERELKTVGNIGIREGKIAAITREEIKGEKIIDAGFNIVCPGFIDIHTHVDDNDYLAGLMALQGVTTVTGGNCGLNTIPVVEYFNKREKEGQYVNQAMYVGQSFYLRQKVGITDPYQAADDDQIRKMVYMAEEALEAGAIGISLGLEYHPGSSFKEAFEMARLAAKYGKLIAVHTRYDAWRALEGINEAIRLCEMTGAPLQLPHLVHVYGVGLMTEVLKCIEKARERGLDIWADSGMHSAFATITGSTVFEDGCVDKWGVGYDSLYVGTGKYAGQQCDREFLKKVRKEDPDSFMIAFANRDQDVIEAIKSPFVMLSSDAIPSAEPGEGHPQEAGTFPRLFSWIVRQQGNLAMIEAIKKCTLYPANRLGLVNKGRIRVGADADITVFDPLRIKDKADYACFGNSHEKPEGISFVINNGKVVVEKGNLLKDAKHGRPIRKENRIWSMQ